MHKPIEIDILDLSNYTSESFVFIYVDVGKMPTRKINEYLKNVKENLSLCEVLERKNIKYSIIPCPYYLESKITNPIYVELGNTVTQLELNLEPTKNTKNTEITEDVRRRTIYEVDIPNNEIAEAMHRLRKTIECKNKKK